MLVLTRRVRFAVNDDAGPPPARIHNAYAGYPPIRALGRHYELDVSCRGQADPATGYSIDIRTIDDAVRSIAVPMIADLCRSSRVAEPGEILPELARAVDEALGGWLAALAWRLTPHYSVALETADMQTVIIRQRFEFSAAHRLHAPELSDEENRRVFGKCNNPGGHGHNYLVEPAVAVRLTPSGRQPFTLPDLERITDEAVIQRLDHKHLNRDVPEFAELNPSVENIARIIYTALSPAIVKASSPPGHAELRSVTVWETEKTSCTYPG